MSSAIQFDPIRLPPEAEALRAEVRAFLNEEIAAGTFDPVTAPYRDGFNPEFSGRDNLYINAANWSWRLLDDKATATKYATKLKTLDLDQPGIDKLIAEILNG